MNWKNKSAAVAAATASKPTTKSTSGSGSSKPKRVTVLDVRVVDTKAGPKPKIQFAKDVEVYFRGEKLDLGEYNSAFLKTKDELISDIDFLVEKEYITEDQAQERADFLDEKNITSQLVVQLK